MIYKVIGIMSGSSLDGLDVAFIHLQKNTDGWCFELKNFSCYPYQSRLAESLSNAHRLGALEYQRLHVHYGAWIGKAVNDFIETNGLHFQVQLISSHGHTVFHEPETNVTAQLGSGASIAAETGINTVSDLRSMDVALGGQGAPIVPIGERLIFGKYDFFLNLGGIANISFKEGDNISAFDVCPANRVLNLLALQTGKPFDMQGEMAATGQVVQELLTRLNELDFYHRPSPKSLPNSLGTELIYPLLAFPYCSPPDALRTYVEHIVFQVKAAIQQKIKNAPGPAEYSLFVSGGGAHNTFLLSRLRSVLNELRVQIHIPQPEIIDFKESIVMALIGVLRWREEKNVLASVTGASRDSIGGTVWMGNEP